MCVCTPQPVGAWAPGDPKEKAESVLQAGPERRTAGATGVSRPGDSPRAWATEEDAPPRLGLWVRPEGSPAAPSMLPRPPGSLAGAPGERGVVTLHVHQVEMLFHGFSVVFFFFFENCGML